MKPFIYAVILITLCSCSKQKEPAKNSTPSNEPEAISFSGKPLFAKAAEPAALAKSDSTINTILSKGNLTEDDFVEIGKHYVATNRYKLAVTNYSEGLTKFPNSYKLLRNRGHRYITLRKLNEAIRDLEKAEELIPAVGDEMEYGLDGKPTATVRHQIHYHIGVYQFLKKDYIKAAAAFEKALAAADNTKNAVGASDWLYNCYIRIGRKDKADELLKPITPDYVEDKDQAYFRRVLFYKGLIKAEELIDVTMPPEKMSIQDVTKLYGLANWHKYKGNSGMANEYYKIILQSDGWPGFAYAAAEKEMIP